MKNVTVSPPKSINTKALQEISVNTMHHKMNKSSHKKSLRKRLSISDEEYSAPYDCNKLSNRSKIVKYISFEDEIDSTKTSVYLENLP